MTGFEGAADMARAAALRAGEYLMRHFGRNQTLMNKDGTSSGVYSEQDRGSSDIIVETLTNLWFEKYADTAVLFISEENPRPVLACRNDAGQVERAEIPGDIRGFDGPCWVIDPICGSIAYARGIRDFIISIALVKGHQVLAAVVYDPSHDEMFHAILGGGAYLKGMRIWPAATADLSESVISLEHRVYQDLPPETVSAIAHAAQKVRTAMTCGLEMCYVACGRIDAVVKLDQAFYDYIGGALILSEALQGKRGLIDLMTRENILPFTHLGCRVSFLASNGLVSNELLRILK